MELRTSGGIPREVIYCGSKMIGDRVAEILGLTDTYQVIEDRYVRKDRAYVVDDKGAVQVVVIQGYGE